MSNGSEVLIYLSFLLKEAVIYLVAAATPNKHMVAMYQKLSFSDFILFYNSKNRHLEFLNLSPQGLISSTFYRYIFLSALIMLSNVSWVIELLTCGYKINLTLSKALKSHPNERIFSSPSGKMDTAFFRSCLIFVGSSLS